VICGPITKIIQNFQKNKAGKVLRISGKIVVISKIFRIQDTSKKSMQNPEFCKSASSRNKFLCSWNLFVKLLNFPPNLDRKRAGSLQQAGGHAEIPRGRRGQQPGWRRSQIWSR
jgi:hypothetical protein